MSNQPDDRPRDDIPKQRPIRSEEDEFEDDLRDRRRAGHEPTPSSTTQPGFGFWMSGVWCLLYLIVTQLMIGGGVAVLGVIYFLLVMDRNQVNFASTKEVMNDPFMNKVMIAALIGAHIGGALFSVLMLRITQGKKWYRVIALNRLPSWTHIALIVIGFPALLTFVAFLEPFVMRYIPSIKDFMDGQGGIEDFMSSIKEWPLSLAIFTIAILPGIGEELWCRGFLGQGTAKRYGILLSVLITSFYFGLIHLEPPQALLAGLIGVFLHLSYSVTRSLWTTVAMHFANNACAVLDAQGYQIVKPLTHALESNTLLVLMSAILLLIAVGHALYQTRCRLTPTDPNLPVHEPKGVDGVEIPPPHSGTIITHEPISSRSALLVMAAAIFFGGLIAWSQQMPLAG